MIFFGQRNFENQQHQSSNKVAKLNSQALNQPTGVNYYVQKQTKQQKQVTQDSDEKKKLFDILDKLLVILSIILMVVGLALLIFGIIMNMIYLYIPGALFIVLSIAGFITSGIFLYFGNRKNKRVIQGKASERKGTGFNNLNLNASVDRRTTRM
jgi:membrane-bound ClpP family serine protease